MHLIIYGAEGSGKGTQAQLLGQKLSLPVYTSGDLVRESAQNDTGPLGDACRTALSSGTYVSNEHMFSLWEKRLESDQAKNGFLLDGFPRNATQAQFLMEVVKKSGYSIDKVIHLHISDDESIKRLSLRNRKLFTGSDESHDSPDRVKKRLAQYRAQEKELLDFFSAQNLVVTVNAAQAREQVFADTVQALHLK
jgi:adenylate kinase